MLMQDVTTGTGQTGYSTPGSTFGVGKTVPPLQLTSLSPSRQRRACQHPVCLHPVPQSSQSLRATGKASLDPFFPCAETAETLSRVGWSITGCNPTIEQAGIADSKVSSSPGVSRSQRCCPSISQSAQRRRTSLRCSRASVPAQYLSTYKIAPAVQLASQSVTGR